MDIPAATCETNALGHDLTAKQLAQRTLDANKAHQYSLTRYAEHLTQELQEIDCILDAADVEDIESDVSGYDFYIEGARKAHGPLNPNDMTSPTSPFHVEATKRMRYIANSTVRPMKPKDLHILAEAIEQEHRRIRAMDAQRRQAHLLLAKKILIRLSSGESLPSNQLVDFNENIDSLDWVAIAEKVTDSGSVKRTPTECKVKWVSDQHPGFNKADWTAAETSQLAKLAAAYDGKQLDIVEISKQLQTNRTPLDCLGKLQKNRKIQVWDDQAIQRLEEGVEHYGLNNWNLVARHVSGNATTTQCQAYHYRHYDPVLKKGVWSDDEDARLLQAIAGYGTVWVDVAEAVGTRTNDQCRQRSKEITTEISRHNWTAEEDAKLVAAVNAIGHSWKRVAEHTGLSRSDQQCRNRYTKLQDRIVAISDPKTDGLFTMSESYDGPLVQTAKSRSEKTIHPLHNDGDGSVGEQVRPKPARKRKGKQNVVSVADGSHDTNIGTEATTSSTTKPRPKPRPKPRTAVALEPAGEPGAEAEAPKTPAKRQTQRTASPAPPPIATVETSETAPARRSARIAKGPARSFVDD